MEIKDLINVQEQFSVNNPYAYALRVFDNDGNIAATTARTTTFVKPMSSVTFFSEYFFCF